jgi:hypothetical protein
MLPSGVGRPGVQRDHFFSSSSPANLSGSDLVKFFQASPIFVSVASKVTLLLSSVKASLTFASKTRNLLLMFMEG